MPIIELYKYKVQSVSRALAASSGRSLSIAHSSHIHVFKGLYAQNSLDLVEVSPTTRTYFLFFSFLSLERANRSNVSNIKA